MELKELFTPFNYSFNPYSIPNIVVGIYCFLLGIFAWIKNRRIQGLALFSITFSSGVWLLVFGLMYLSNNPDTAFLWNKVAHFLGGVCFISVSGYFFALTFTGRINIKRDRIFLLSGYLIMVVFAFLVVFTDLVIKYPPRKLFWGYYTNIGVLHNVFLPLWVTYALKGGYITYKAYIKEQNLLEKSRFKIYLSGYLFGYLAACDYLGAYGIGSYPFGYVFIATYLTLFTYNIIKYRALEFETVIHKTLLWIVSILIIILPAGILGFLVFKKVFLLLHPLLNVFFFSLTLVSFAYYYFYLRPKVDQFFGRKEFAQYEVLGKVAQQVSTTLDIHEFSLRLFKEISLSIYPQKIFLWLKDEKKQLFSLYARKVTSKEAEFVEDQQLSLSLSDEISQYLINTKETLETLSISIRPQLQYLQQSPYFSLLKEQEIELLVPLIMEEDLVGVLGLAKKQSLRLYTLKDIEIFNSLSKELGPFIYNTLHHKDAVEKERLDEELKLGREIQMNLLPHQIPQVPCLSLQGMMTPAKEIGGDYYDFITLPNKEELAIVIGDVSGKGVAAGLLMSMVKATIHAFSQEETSPKQILLRTNAFLHQHIGGQKFMTLLYLLWHSSTKILIYSSAGHEHILIYRCSSQQIEIIQSGGFMLGMIPDIEKFLEEREIELNPGDKILLYTDGVTEAENASGDRFGLERLKESFQRHSQKPANELMEAVKDETYAFIGAHPQYDDITLVVMEAV